MCHIVLSKLAFERSYRCNSHWLRCLSDLFCARSHLISSNMKYEITVLACFAIALRLSPIVFASPVEQATLEVQTPSQGRGKGLWGGFLKRDAIDLIEDFIFGGTSRWSAVMHNRRQVNYVDTNIIHAFHLGLFAPPLPNFVPRVAVPAPAPRDFDWNAIDIQYVSTQPIHQTWF